MAGAGTQVSDKVDFKSKLVSQNEGQHIQLRGKVIIHKALLSHRVCIANDQNCSQNGGQAPDQAVKGFGMLKAHEKRPEL